MEQPPFIDGHYYHVFNRGAGKCRIFDNDKDRFRFVHDLFEFNDRDAVINARHVFKRTYRGETSESSVGGPGPKPAPKKRKLLVDILAWALMPNHYHLLLRLRSDDGISLFMKKLGGGYTLYFNEKHERTGVLFQGTFKAKHVTEDRYLRHLVSYIHLNPLDIDQPNWREEGFNQGQVARAMRFLDEYRWSSYLDYIGEKNVPSLLNMDLVRDLGMPVGEAHEKDIREWTEAYQRREAQISNIILE